jgi:DNA-binding transcriptional LysR family regulator
MQYDNIDLNLLRVFDALMREQNVTRAAERTARTQSAVSHSLGKLRELFQDELFTRVGSTMQPTARARELDASITSAMLEIRRAIDRHLVFNAKAMRREFRVGVSDYTAIEFVPALVEGFNNQAPNSTLKVLHIRDQEVPTLLRSSFLDCAIMGNANIDDDDLLQRVVSRHKVVCVMWKGNPIPAPITLDAYLQARHLQVSADGVSPGVMDRVLAQRGLSRDVHATISHYLVAPWVMKGTDLLTVMGDGVLVGLDDRSEVTIAALPIEVPDVEITTTIHLRTVSDLGTRWLLDLIKSATRESAETKRAAYLRLNPDLA